MLLFRRITANYADRRLYTVLFRIFKVFTPPKIPDGYLDKVQPPEVTLAVNGESEN